MKEFLLVLMERLGIACWVEVKTDYPRCVYYFGPFFSRYEAKVSLSGYLEDLQAEGAQGIKYKIERCDPAALTIFDEAETSQSFSPVAPVLRSEAF
jgi:hypothetical protein